MVNKPAVGVGAVVIHEDKVLLVKRKNQPAKGQWAIPGGKLKWGETLQEAAEREVLEETGIRITAGDPVYTFEVIDRGVNGDIRFHYIIIDLNAEYSSGQLLAGDDAVEARWVGAGEFNKLDINSKTRELLTRYFDS